MFKPPERVEENDQHRDARGRGRGGKVNPRDELVVYGAPASCATNSNVSSEHLFAWLGDASCTIDRFDVRLLLDEIDKRMLDHRDSSASLSDDNGDCDGDSDDETLEAGVGREELHSERFSSLFDLLAQGVLLPPDAAGVEGFERKEEEIGEQDLEGS